MYRKRILIDLDGVLNKYVEYDENSIPDIREGAIEFIRLLYERGYELYLFTTRNLLLSARWLIDNGIDKYFKDITNVKMPSYLIIDDRCICFKGDYRKVLEDIEGFRVYWKQ